MAKGGVLKVTSRLENRRLWAEFQRADRRQPILPVLQSDQGIEEREKLRLKSVAQGQQERGDNLGGCCKLSNHLCNYLENCTSSRLIHAETAVRAGQRFGNRAIAEDSRQDCKTTTLVVHSKRKVFDGPNRVSKYRCVEKK